jgi:excisionase family DNA binding protein
MGYFEGKFVMINNPTEAHYLEVAITAALKHWRSVPLDVSAELPVLSRIQSELHTVATSETAKETPPRHDAKQLVSQEHSPASLTTYEAAKRLNVSVQMVRRYCDAGRLTWTRPGRSYMIDPRSVEAFRAEQEQKSA